MFSAVLKQSSIWRSEIPALASPNGLNLRETHFETQDLSIPLRSSSTTSIAGTNRNASTDAQRALRVLLLTPLNLSPASLDATTARLTRFAHLTGGVDLVVVFLLQAQTISSNGDKEPTTASPTNAHVLLQTLIMRSPDLRGIPILPIAKTSALVEVLRSYITAVTQATLPHPPQKALDILPYCTTTGPTRLLTSTLVGVLSDMIPDLKTLARLACLEMPDDGRDMQDEAFRPVDFEMEDHADMVLRRDIDHALRQMVSEKERVGIWEFWRGEFVID